MCLSKEEKERIKLLEHCYTHFIEKNKAIRTDGYVQKTLDFYYKFRKEIKMRMKDPEKLIDCHKITAGTVLSILMALQVKPDCYDRITDWVHDSNVISLNVDFAIFTAGYFLTSEYITNLEKAGMCEIDMYDHKNKFYVFTQKYEYACGELKMLFSNIVATMHKKEYPVDRNYIFFLAYKFFLIDELMKTF